MDLDIEHKPPQWVKVRKEGRLIGFIAYDFTERVSLVRRDGQTREFGTDGFAFAWLTLNE